MSILFVLIPLSLLLVVCVGWAFFWAVGSGQFDELEAPAWDVLRDERGQAAAAAEPSSPASETPP